MFGECPIRWPCGKTAEVCDVHQALVWQGLVKIPVSGFQMKVDRRSVVYKYIDSTGTKWCNPDNDFVNSAVNFIVENRQYYAFIKLLRTEEVDILRSWMTKRPSPIIKTRHYVNSSLSPGNSVRKTFQCSFTFIEKFKLIGCFGVIQLRIQSHYPACMRLRWESGERFKSGIAIHGPCRWKLRVSRGVETAVTTT